MIVKEKRIESVVRIKAMIELGRVIDFTTKEIATLKK